MNSYIGLYGTIALPKVYCLRCRRLAFSFDNRLACCGGKVKAVLEGVKREIEFYGTRVKPSSTYQKMQLTLQEHRCLYCQRRFGSTVYRGPKLIRLKIHWDHLIPFAYLRSNPLSNFIAACHICNAIKGDRMFETIEEIASYVAAKREAKGYADVPAVWGDLAKEPSLAEVLLGHVPVGLLEQTPPPPADHPSGGSYAQITLDSGMRLS